MPALRYNFMSSINQELEAAILKRQGEQAVEDQLGTRAALEPLPGPLRDLFSPQPPERVGDILIREFCDCDFEYMAALNHEMHRVMQNGMNGKDEVANFVPRGRPVWEMAWLLSHSIDEIDELFAKGGKEAVVTAARKQFGKYNLGVQVKLYAACMRQITRYWSSVISHADAGVKNNEDANAPANPR